MNRFQRRRAAAKARTRISKKEQFGRIIVTNIEDEYIDLGYSANGPIGREQAIIEYTHTTKGRMRRVLTTQLMHQLAA